MAAPTNLTRNARSSTIPTKASGSSTSSIGKSKRVLVYDFVENKTRRMTRAKFQKEYSDVGEIVTIPIPKGASILDLSPDDLSPAYENEVRTSTHINTSYTASVHIPATVFLARMLVSPDPYPELTVVPNSSPSSSRTNTGGLNTTG